MVEQLSPFVDYVKTSQVEAEKRYTRLAIPDEKYNMLVEQLDLSTRALNCLRRSGINTVGEIISMGERELLNLHNFGQKSRQEVEASLKALGLSISPQVKEETETEHET